MTTLLALGDVCPGDHYFTLGHGLGSRLAAGAQPFAPVLPTLREADLVIANLEGCLAHHSDRPEPVESAVFRGVPETARRLREANIQVAHVANNHAMQHGAEAFRTTRAALEEAGVAPLGLRGEGFACAPLIRQVGELAVGFLGYSLAPEHHVPAQEEYAAPALADMLADVRALACHVDAVVVSVHWGDEAVALPSPEVIATAHALIDAGARVVLGHHSHVFQPVVQYRGGLIAYSLGNAAFDLFWHRSLVESALLRIQLDRAAAPTFELIPVRFGTNYQLAPLPPRRAAAFRDRLDGATAMLENLSPDEYAGFYVRHLAAAERAVQWKKVPFFLGNMARGHARHKAAFIYRKLVGRWSAA